jgi:hypothetical protein
VDHFLGKKIPISGHRKILGKKIPISGQKNPSRKRLWSRLLNFDALVMVGLPSFHWRLPEKWMHFFMTDPNPPIIGECIFR